jgi:hypothetical protein
VYMVRALGLHDKCGEVLFIMFVYLIVVPHFLGKASPLCYNTLINKRIVNRVYTQLN